MKKSLKEKCLTRTYKKTSHMTLTLYPLYKLFLCIKFMSSDLILYKFRLNIFTSGISPCLFNWLPYPRQTFFDLRSITTVHTKLLATHTTFPGSFSDPDPLQETWLRIHFRKRGFGSTSGNVDPDPLQETWIQIRVAKKS